VIDPSIKLDAVRPHLARHVFELVVRSRTRPSHTLAVRFRLVTGQHPQGRIKTGYSECSRHSPFTSVLVCRSLEIVLFADQSPTTAPLHGSYSYIFNIAAHRSGLVPRQLLSYGKYWPSPRSSSRWRNSSSMDERVEVQCPAFSNKVNPAFESTSHSCPPFNQCRIQGSFASEFELLYTSASGLSRNSIDDRAVSKFVI
jgi:hypothetical protein